MSEKVMTKKAAPKEEAEKKEAEKRAPEMTPEMLANFGKKAKEKRDERTLSGDQEDAKKHSSLGESRLMTLTSFLAAYETPIIPIYQRVNGWTRAQKETTKVAIDPFGIKEKEKVEALFSRIGFVLHDYGEIDLQEQILAFDELNRHEEAYRLADRYRATMLSALPEREHRHFAALYDEAWRLSTVLFRLANLEDYELSFDLPDQERPAGRPSLFRLQSPAEIAARIAPSGTPRPYIPESAPEDKSLLPLKDPLPALSADELEDEEPLVSVREPIVREKGIVEMIRAFLTELDMTLDESTQTPRLMTSTFLEKSTVFGAQRELDYADHLSTKAKYFAFLCYLRVANPQGRVPVAWADAFGCPVSGGLEKLLPVKNGACREAHSPALAAQQQLGAWDARCLPRTT